MGVKENVLHLWESLWYSLAETWNELFKWKLRRKRGKGDPGQEDLIRWTRIKVLT